MPLVAVYSSAGGGLNWNALPSEKDLSLAQNRVPEKLIPVCALKAEVEIKYELGTAIKSTATHTWLGGRHLLKGISKMEGEIQTGFWTGGSTAVERLIGEAISKIKHSCYRCQINRWYIGSAGILRDPQWNWWASWGITTVSCSEGQTLQSDTWFEASSYHPMYIAHLWFNYPVFVARFR
jgi:hypothetical protein